MPDAANHILFSRIELSTVRPNCRSDALDPDNFTPKCAAKMDEIFYLAQQTKG
jgi:hypothetical protein